MNIEEKVKSILCELSGEKIIEKALNLQGDLALDSLMMVTMLVEIEEMFEIELDESDMNPFSLVTVADVVEMVERYCSNDDK